MAHFSGSESDYDDDNEWRGESPYHSRYGKEEDDEKSTDQFWDDDEIEQYIDKQFMLPFVRDMMNKYELKKFTESLIERFPHNWENMFVEFYKIEIKDKSKCYEFICNDKISVFIPIKYVEKYPQSILKMKINFDKNKNNNNNNNNSNNNSSNNNKFQIDFPSSIINLLKSFLVRGYWPNKYSDSLWPINDMIKYGFSTDINNRDEFVTGFFGLDCVYQDDTQIEIPELTNKQFKLVKIQSNDGKYEYEFPLHKIENLSINHPIRKLYENSAIFDTQCKKDKYLNRNTPLCANISEFVLDYVYEFICYDIKRFDDEYYEYMNNITVLEQNRIYEYFE